MHNNQNINQALENCQRINIIINNQHQQNTNCKEQILQCFENCRQMPAFGVSLHSETIRQLQSGIWIEFEYNTTQLLNEMPFDTLLINLQNDFSGLNVIRKYQGKYDGRCFYVDLATTTTALYNFIVSLINQ